MNRAHDEIPVLELTIEHLPCSRAELDVSLAGSALKEYFEQRPEAPGLIVTDAGRFVSAISRDNFFRRLSQPFGREIFLRRPISEFLKVWGQEALICPWNCTIHHATELALDRQRGAAYEPIVVEHADGSRGILDMHALLVAQSRVLASTREIEEQRRLAAAANEAKSEFLANISHELRTPLHGIASYARFGCDEFTSADRGELRDYFAQIEDCSQTLLHLVNELLDLSKLEAGKMQFEFLPVCIGELASGIVDEFNSICARNQVRVEYHPPEDDLPMLADPERIKAVLRNLISNAVKFSPPEGRVAVRLRSTGESMLLSVTDQGPGIPEDELEAIFDKFVQSTKTKSGAGGTGLGLAICREIVAGHQGRIWAENGRDHGAIFWCDLPIRAPQDADDEAVLVGSKAP